MEKKGRSNGIEDVKYNFSCQPVSDQEELCTRTRRLLRGPLGQIGLVYSYLPATSRSDVIYSK